MMRWRRSDIARATLSTFLCLYGASAFAQGDAWPGEIEDHFRRLRASIQKDEGPAEIYALLSTLTQRIIEVKKDGTAMLHYDDSNGRTRDRAIPADELAQLRRWLSKKKVDELPPYDPSIFDGIQYEYVHLDRKGTERRVPMNNPPETIAAASSEFGGQNPRAYGALMQRMLALDATKVPVVYRSLQPLPGFRLVYTATNNEFVSALALRNGQLLAEVWPTGKAKTWHVVTNRGIAPARVVEPRHPLEREWWPKYFAGDDYVDATEGPYTGKRLWRGTRRKDEVEGLWASGVKGAPELIARGVFSQLIICPGGEWIVTEKTAPNTVVRIHLPTRTIAPVELPAADDYRPILWLESHRRVLLYQQRDDDYRGGQAGPKDREYYLLDPATGRCERVNGDFRPLTDYNNLPRQLQPSAEKNVVWGTVVHWKPDRPGEADTDIGKYSVQDFVFSPLLHLPGVHVDSDQMVVDEKAGEVWLLLSVSGDIAKVTLPVSPAGPR
jgi:hypothetical protein